MEGGVISDWRSKRCGLSFHSMLRFWLAVVSSGRRIILHGEIKVARGDRVAAVTGGNKGIGLEVCRQLAGAGATVVLTARDETRGAAAVEKLREAGLSDVMFHQLDITDAPSIARLADFLKARFGKLDILVRWIFKLLVDRVRYMARD